MSRGLASAITDELAKGQFTMAHLVSLELDSSWLFTDAPCDVIDPDSNTFRFWFSFTSGSTAATVESRSWHGSSFVPYLHAQLAAGMTLTNWVGGGEVLQEDTEIASVGDSPDITLSLPANYTDEHAETMVNGDYSYKAGGFLLGLDGVKESSNLNIGSLTIGISSVNQTVISDVLNNGHLNRKVTIKRAFLDSDYTVISGAVFSVYSGRIEGMTIKDSGEDSVMELSVANHWSDFNRDNGRQTNNTSQQHHFENDMSMEFAPQTGKKLLWGAIEVSSGHEGPNQSVGRWRPRGH